MPVSGNWISGSIRTANHYVCWMGCCLMLVAVPALGQSMVFISPGQDGEPFWRDSARAMQEAAQSLGVQLEILYAERDYLAQIHLTREVTQRPQATRPDYLIFAADKGTLESQLVLAEEAGIHSFSAYNSVSGAVRERLGNPRERFQYWLGSLTPKAEEAGYLSAKALIEEGLHNAKNEGATLDMLAISGDRATDSSVRRNQGMRMALAEYPQVRLRQLVHGDWRQDKAAEQAVHLFKRYPNTRLIWAGSDLMAFGAMQSLGELGITPGRDLYFSAVNTSSRAMQAVIDGKLAALAGGHFLNGAWAIVMLHDYHRGIDFALNEGLVLERSMFMLFDPQQARRYLASQAIDAPIADYCHFSKACNRLRTEYDFSIQSWLEAQE